VLKLYFSFLDVSFNDSETGMEVYLKYKAVEDKTLNFDGAVEECDSLDSMVWEVISGASEWEAVHGSLLGIGKGDVWINGDKEGIEVSENGVICSESDF
jgi:hypothetical protein